MTDPNFETGLSKIASDLINGTVPADEQQEVAPWMGAIGSLKNDFDSGKSARQSLYENLLNQDSTISKYKSKLLMQMNEDAPMSKSQTAAMLLIGILPILAGGAIKGKKGLAIGAESGALGTTVLAKGIEADQERARKRASLEYSALEDQQTSIRKNAFDLSRDEAKASDVSEQKDLDRESRELIAANKKSASGVEPESKQEGQDLLNESRELKNKELKRKASITERGFNLGAKAYVPNGNVDEKTATKVRGDATLYNSILKKLVEIQRLDATLDVPTASRQAGPTGNKIAKLHTSLMQDLRNLKKVKGTFQGGLEAIADLSEDPTTFWNNMQDLFVLPASTIDEQIENTKSVLYDDFAGYLESNNYTGIPIGKEFNTKDKGRVIFKGVLPGGKLHFVPKR